MAFEISAFTGLLQQYMILINNAKSFVFLQLQPSNP